MDTSARDSLACDLMEAIRPRVDAYVLDWILSRPLRREWFFEQRDGNCRLMASFAIRLTEASQAWARAIGPVAEMVVRQLWLTTRKRTSPDLPPTRLTQNNKRHALDVSSRAVAVAMPRSESLCRGCGKPIRAEHNQCRNCAVSGATERLATAAKLGRVASRSVEARARHSASRKRHAAACSAWLPSSQPAWLTRELFSHKIQPLLADISTAAIRSQIGVSRWYASRIRQGYRPHPRHWKLLATLVGFSAGPIIAVAST
jgi:hypothetical protein